MVNDTAPLPISPCPNPECGRPCDDFFYIPPHPDDDPDGKQPVNHYVSQVACLGDCGYRGPLADVIGDDVTTAKKEAVRLHNLVCRPASPSTAEAAREILKEVYDGAGYVDEAVVAKIISKHLPSPQGEPVGELIIRDGIVSFHTLIPIERLISGQLFAAPGSAPGYVMPIDALLFCPKCGTQHVDAPEPENGWINPPHRKHLCHACKTIWLAAHIPTNGVAALGAAPIAPAPVPVIAALEELAAELKIEDPELLEEANNARWAVAEHYLLPLILRYSGAALV